MTRARRTLLAGGILVAGLLLALVLGLVLIGRVDSQSVGDALLRKASAELGLRLDAERIDLGPVRGLELEGFRAAGRLDAGRLEIEATKLVLKPRLLPLLRGDVVVREAILEAPEILLTRRDQPRVRGAGESGRAANRANWRRDGRKKGPAPEQALAALDPSAPRRANEADVEIHRLRLIDANLTLVSPRAAQDTARLESLNLELTGIELEPESERTLLDATAVGSFTAGAVTVSDTAGTEARGSIELADGILRLTDLEMTHELGPIRAPALDVDLTKKPFEYELALVGGPLDTGQLLGAAPDSGMGDSSLRFAGSGSGPDSDDLSGSGSLSVRGGSLPEIPVLIDLDRLLGTADLVGSRHEPTEIEFRLTGDRIDLEPSRFEADGVRLDLSGWAEREGDLHLDLVVSAPRGRIKIAEISETVLDKLTDAEGRTALAFRLRGSRARPEVLPDLPEITRGERERLERELKDALREKLREILGGDDDG